MKSGYLVNENIGIGQFKIDLAIYDEESKEWRWLPKRPVILNSSWGCLFING